MKPVFSPRNLRPRFPKPSVGKGLAASMLTPKKSKQIRKNSIGKGLASMLTPKKSKQIRKNCHIDHKKHFIELQCQKCTLNFCGKALRKHFHFLRDTKTGKWSCPRCTGWCKCEMCLVKKKSTAELEEMVGELLKERVRLEKRVKQSDALITEYRSLCPTLEAKCVSVSEDLTETRRELTETRRELTETRNRLDVAERQIVDGEKIRRKMHNTILELKGNIRVFCRVRPDDGIGSISPFSYPPSTELSGQRIQLAHGGSKHTFTVDKVFTAESSQEDVFAEISELVQSAIDGYQVTIFAYGQTGSGKTFTMMGGQNDIETGLIPRSLKQIFIKIQALAAQGWIYKMEASMLEIYNGKIYDLLTSRRGKQQDDIKLEDKEKRLTRVDVRTIRHVLGLLQRASNNRTNAGTDMNEASSRSHLVVTLSMLGENQSTGEKVEAKLNFIDLAGSEKFSSSGTDRQLEETKEINTSLTSLSDVISALANKARHIPYRNSTLTRLLQPCLEGNGKTLMFVNLSSNASSTGESLNSLRFAKKASTCHVGGKHR